MYTIDHAERALRQHDPTEKTLKRYSIPVLQELCVKRGIDVGGSSRPLKKPYIDALLIHSIADENRGHQQQEHSDEPASTFRFTQPTAAEHSHSEVDTFYVRHALTPAPTDDQEKMPDGNTDFKHNCNSKQTILPFWEGCAEEKKKSGKLHPCEDLRTTKGPGTYE
ncbi:hypothetical protein F5148DRAFT_1154731 [Russula earlei]|uniref:Uncharacterized protein n=1 Tax=Russula earlei TaxID=71964 RepID=A0ACC0TRA6_9AGAM|nr:hypothetical protein F5148DRAFT_1154731 [Russula earlei]